MCVCTHLHKIEIVLIRFSVQINFSLARFHIIPLFCAISGQIVRYDNHKLYEIRLNSGLAARIKRQIDRHTILDHDKNNQNETLTVLVEPHKASAFETLLNNNSISHEILVRSLLAFIMLRINYRCYISRISTSNE